MLDFFKKNLFLIIYIIVCLILFALGFVSVVCLIISSFLTGVLLIYFSYKFKIKYKNKKDDENTNQNIFDATKLDYDEDIYYIGNPSKKIQVKSNVLSKINSKLPSVIFAVFGFGLIIMSISFLIKIFI